MTQILQKFCYIAILVILFLFLSMGLAHAIDVISSPIPPAKDDRRREYSIKLLQEVLRRTEPKYGAYKLEFSPIYMERDRIFLELKSGARINLVANPANRLWNDNLIAIAIPIDMGVQSWRIALINEEKQNLLRNVRSLDELKRLRVGGNSKWVSYQSLIDNGFNGVAGNNYEGLFEMLTLNRFDYLLRGVNEVFIEFDQRKDSYKKLAVEDSFVVHDFIPRFFYVSPKYPRIANRISSGIEMMLQDGSLKRFVLDHFQGDIKRAQLCSRRLYEIPNHSIDAAILARKELWFDPFDPKNGICPARSNVNREMKH